MIQHIKYNTSHDKMIQHTKCTTQVFTNVTDLQHVLVRVQLPDCIKREVPVKLFTLNTVHPHTSQSFFF